MEYAERERARQQRRDYHCYVTFENIGHIADRIERLAASGRRMTIVEMIGESDRPYKVTTGLTLNHQAMGGAINRRDDGISVYLDPGIQGFGVHAWRWKTLAQLHAELDQASQYRKDHKLTKRDVFGRDPENTYVDIHGGLDGDGPGREDRIEIRDLNQHGVMLTKVIAFDDDPLRRPLREPHKWREWDPDGADAAQEIAAEVPEQVEWAILKRHATNTDGTSALQRLAELDAKLRPWAHQPATPPASTEE